MGVTEYMTAKRLKDESRLEAIISRQLEIAHILDDSVENIVQLLSEYDNLCIERENIERNLQKKYI